MSSSTITATAKPQATGDAKVPAAGDAKFDRGAPPQATGDAKFDRGTPPQAAGDAKMPDAKVPATGDTQKMTDEDIISKKRSAHNAICRIATDIEMAAMKGDSASLKTLVPNYLEMLEIVRKLCLAGAGMPFASEKLSGQLHIGLALAHMDLFEAKQRSLHADSILRLSSCVSFGYSPDDKSLSAGLHRATILIDTDEKLCQTRVSHFETMLRVMLRVTKTIEMDEDVSAAENK